MRIVDRRAVPAPRSRRTAQLRIPLSDGTRLAGRVWRPEASDTAARCRPSWSSSRTASATSPRCGTRSTTPTSPGTATPGVRVDLRGSGDSEGVLTDEYLEQELCDAEEVLAWLAAQPWCDGRTGMMGISWGGFNALQVAARRPPSLGADRHRLLHRRPVRRRRALHGRLPADRQPVVGVDDVRLQLLPAGPGRGRRALAGDVARAAATAAGSGWRSGCATSVATTTGGTARSARTTPPSRARCSPSAAGPTATRTRCSGCWPRSTCRRKGLIGPVVAQVPAPRRARPGHRLPAGARPLVGPLAARTSTTASWTSRCCASGCRRACRRRRPTRSGRAAGSASRAGPPRTSRAATHPLGRPPDPARRRRRRTGREPR